MASSGIVTVSSPSLSSRPVQSDPSILVREAPSPRTQSYKLVGVAIDTPPASAPSEEPAPRSRVSRPEKIVSKLKTRALHDFRQAERLRLNPYLGDPWPTRLSPGIPCHCLNAAAHSICDAASRSAISYYTRLVATHAARSGTEPPLIDPWEHELIRKRLSKAQQQAVHDIRASTGLVTHNSRDVGGRIHDQAADVDYSGHVQPWMDALIHRVLTNAAVEAFKEIDERYGTKIYEESKQNLQFSFKLPGIVFSNPLMSRFPCLCKEATANRIADITLNNSMMSVKKHTGEGPVSRQFIMKHLEMSIARATVDALGEIAEIEDNKHMCSARGPAPHMKLSMIMKVHS